MVVVVADFLFDKLEVFCERCDLVGLELHHRLHAGKHKQRAYIVYALDDLVEEIHTHHDAQALHIIRALVTIDNVAFAYHQQLAGMHHQFFGVHAVANLSFGAKTNQNKVCFTRLAGHGGLVNLVG